MADRWPTRTLPDYNCEVASLACRKRRLLGSHQWQSALVVVGLPVTEDVATSQVRNFCHLSTRLISIRLTACRNSIPRKRRGNRKQTNKGDDLKRRGFENHRNQTRRSTPPDKNYFLQKVTIRTTLVQRNRQDHPWT